MTSRRYHLAREVERLEAERVRLERLLAHTLLLLTSGDEAVAGELLELLGELLELDLSTAARPRRRLPRHEFLKLLRDPPVEEARCAA